MKPTPINEFHNEHVLQMIPAETRNIIEVGCSSGALAKKFKELQTGSNWIGVEKDAEYAELARRYCDKTIVLDLENCGSEFYESYSDRDCWIFADVLEHFKDPWSVVKNIRSVIPKHGSVIACVPNIQYWVVLASLAVGNFQYEDQGVMDRTHLRWFTRKSLFQLFEDEGFIIAEGVTRFAHHPDQGILELIGKLAERVGSDPVAAMNDAIPMQYVVRAVPR